MRNLFPPRKGLTPQPQWGGHAEHLHCVRPAGTGNHPEARHGRLLFRCLKGFHMSGQAPYGFQLEPTTVEGIHTKMMVPAPAAADRVCLMFTRKKQIG